MRTLKTLATSIMWIINIALAATNRVGFEVAWLWGILGGVLIFSLLSLVEDEEWHELLFVILFPTGVGFAIMLICVIIFALSIL